MNKAEELKQKLIKNYPPGSLSRSLGIDVTELVERFEKDLDEFAEQYAQQREKPELINETYYLVLTVENKWGIAYWKDKWWDSPEQDFKLAFGIKDGWIKTWYSLPNHQNHFLTTKTNSNE